MELNNFGEIENGKEGKLKQGGLARAQEDFWRQMEMLKDSLEYDPRKQYEKHSKENTWEEDAKWNT